MTPWVGHYQIISWSGRHSNNDQKEKNDSEDIYLCDPVSKKKIKEYKFEIFILTEQKGNNVDLY